MSTKTTMGSMFPAEAVKEVFSKVKDHSTLAKLANQMAVPFAGADIFTFSLDGEISIVGEGGQKPAGTATVKPVTVKPIKVVYQHRVSDEFLRASEEKALDMLSAFSEGFARKIAAGLDIMAFHGVNPFDLQPSATIGDNHLDCAAIDEIPYSSDVEADLTQAVAVLDEYPVTGYALSKTFGAALGSCKENGVSQFPEFKLGGNPGHLAGIACDINRTVDITGSAMAYVGDFANAFRWGYAANVPMEVIQYGDPDGLGDLKRTNEVVLRAEAYIGWAILDNNAFARIGAAEAVNEPE